MSDLRFPIGPFKAPQQITAELRQQFIADIEQLPAKLKQAAAKLNASQLDTPYRPEGWTVRQVVHHLADSHMNAYIRVRLALTEDAPTIKPYAEDRWAKLSDAHTAPIETSLDLLTPLHERWVLLLRSIKPEEWSRTMKHPERGEVSLDNTTALYSWHGRHHTAHITSLRERMGW
jgi:hypothetical protein